MDYLRRKLAKKIMIKKQASTTDYREIGLNYNKLIFCLWWDWKTIMRFYHRAKPGKFRALLPTADEIQARSKEKTGGIVQWQGCYENSKPQKSVATQKINIDFWLGSVNGSAT
ncbi:hypothetical protein EVAR_31467_1 [Eumeta japonica]|uniref:Mariner Mos1 transposase n=1 Tax=Eumeta variegata TaxID=151549 RepID=A0A4C1WCR3_EUMVA|nr:hypothetical protein EVAR_31467_1 [Eumeta japonica]